MNRKIEEALERGKGKIRQEEQERIRIEAARADAHKKAWCELDAQWREALPEVIREYMEVVFEGELLNFSSYDPSYITQQELSISIPGFAPIKTWVEKDPHGTWKQTGQVLNGRMANYSVPEAHHEDGVHWCWGNGGRSTDDLDVALAWAQEQYECWINLPSPQKTKQDKEELSYETMDETVLNNEYTEGSYREIARTIVKNYMKCL